MAKYTDAQAEALVLVMEECAEAIQAATKCLRHGETSYNPYDDEEVTNRASLNKELGHVTLALQLAVEQNIVDADELVRHRDIKRANIARWLHHFKPRS
jgi:hypothetical protein